MYKYFIVYYFDYCKQKGFGNCTYETIVNIKNMNDIRQIENIIKDYSNFDKVVILNYILLDRGQENDR